MTDLPASLPTQVCVGLESDGLPTHVAQELKIQLIVRVHGSVIGIKD